MSLADHFKNRDKEDDNDTQIGPTGVSVMPRFSGIKFPDGKVVRPTEAIEKVLIHDEAPTEVHLVKGSFMRATETICGERLHSCCCVHIVNDAIPVTCLKCSNAALNN